MPARLGPCDRCGKLAQEEHIYRTSHLRDAKVYSPEEFSVQRDPKSGGIAYRHRGRAINASLTVQYGNLYAYWYTMKEDTAQFCSRRCAARWAERRNALLFGDHGTSVLTPHQRAIDAYAIVKGLTFHLLQKKEGQAARIEELEARLTNPRLDPRRLHFLALRAHEWGYESLAHRTAEFILSEYPLEQGGLAAMILQQLGRFHDIDVFYEHAASELGGRDRLAPSALSSWATLIALETNLSEKALALSREALRRDPGDEHAFANHFGILRSAGADADAVAAHADTWGGELTTHLGLYQAGVALSDVGRWDEARNLLTKAYARCSDALTALHLAEAYGHTDRPHEALALVRQGRRLTEEAPPASYQDANGLRANVQNDSYGTKTSLRRLFLALEGRLLVELGEKEPGRQRLRDALDMSGPLTHRLLDGIDRLADGYPARTQLTDQLDARSAELELVSKRAQALRRALEEDREDAATQVAELEAALMEAASNATPSFPEIRESAETMAREDHGPLPKPIASPLQEAYFLRAVLADAGPDLRDRTAPMVYYAKALELHLRAALRSLGIDEPREGLGAVERALNTHAQRFIERGRISAHNLYALITSVRRFRTQYRNGFVHAEVMDQPTLEDLFRFGREARLFQPIA